MEILTLEMCDSVLSHTKREPITRRNSPYLSKENLKSFSLDKSFSDHVQQARSILFIPNKRFAAADGVAVAAVRPVTDGSKGKRITSTGGDETTVFSHDC